MLFPAIRNVPLSGKFDIGARLCKLDITSLHKTSADDLAAFAATEGAKYARLGPGDVLFLPKGWFHAVIALTPSVSVTTFGYSPLDLLTVGAPLGKLD